MSRKTDREEAFKKIFESLFVGDESLNTEFDIETEPSEFTTQIFNAYKINRVAILEKVKTATSEEKYARFYKVDLALVILAITEIDYTETPVSVAVNEAVELAKKFSTDDSPAFVNGFLKTMLSK